MLQFPQLFFHLKAETNVILSPKFWRMNKHPLLELQSQLKLLGHFAVFLPSCCDGPEAKRQHWVEAREGDSAYESGGDARRLA